ncbi:SoxR reducing system RseC family protein [candidate division WOR-3 bacterium]|nr:SoxR reducing system RseC family protein [candidate division WOR-3 bacterium]
MADIIMEEIGKVIKTNKNRAIVLIELPQSCDSCEFAKFCRIDKNGREIVCRNEKGAKVGDIVQIETSNKNVFKAMVLHFLLPLFFLTGGVLAGKKLWQTDLKGFMLGMFLMVMYFSLFLFIDKKMLKSGQLLPEIVKITEKRTPSA